MSPTPHPIHSPNIPTDSVKPPSDTPGAPQGERIGTPLPAVVDPPTRIGRKDASGLQLDWPDGTSTWVPASEIRKACGCAHCVDEHTGRPILDPATVPADLEHSSVELMGRYAIAITFSDGHRTGIYTWRLLRSLAS